ncbi:B3 DNA binding domain-containing protein [Artemisia annua]|uniref:B3 DNA binding domain-containing protein n=1 Tax=Artemisia annua TaxID=35608 RepID=A0A2U1M4H2_ARTAN|nr:B3 DNA binding domain-containing protein [Artemisia annua]
MWVGNTTVGLLTVLHDALLIALTGMCGFIGTTANAISFYLIADHGRLAFLFSKKLQKSDVGVLKRNVLPKKPAETHLPALIAKEGIVLKMDDMDGMNVWGFKFRFWPNNNSRIYVFEGTGIFLIFVLALFLASRSMLNLISYVVAISNVSNGSKGNLLRSMSYNWPRFSESQLCKHINIFTLISLHLVIHVVKAYEVEQFADKDVKTNLATQVKSGKAPPNNVGLMNQNWPWGGLEVEVFNPINYPTNESPVENQMDMTFVYDTSYSNDTITPLDFLGGFMSSYPTAQPNFAIDNLYIDDLYKI